MTEPLENMPRTGLLAIINGLREDLREMAMALSACANVMSIAGPRPGEDASTFARRLRIDVEARTKTVSSFAPTMWRAVMDLLSAHRQAVLDENTPAEVRQFCSLAMERATAHLTDEDRASIALAPRLTSPVDLVLGLDMRILSDVFTPIENARILAETQAETERERRRFEAEMSIRSTVHIRQDP